MNKVIVYKNTLGDTRTAERMPTKEEFDHSNWLHKDDVMSLACEFANELKCRCGNHDWTKVQEPYASKFYNLMKATIEDGADFMSGEWAHLHFDVLERHHLNRHCPDDVDLFDVLEMIFDCVSAGMARSGSVYPLEISNEILQKAVTNTVNYIVENIEIAESGEISEEDEIRIYSKIYADNEPKHKAEKIYQICQGEELKEVVSWLREYAESEE